MATVQAIIRKQDLEVLKSIVASLQDIRRRAEEYSDDGIEAGFLLDAATSGVIDALALLRAEQANKVDR